MMCVCVCVWKPWNLHIKILKRRREKEKQSGKKLFVLNFWRIYFLEQVSVSLWVKLKICQKHEPQTNIRTSRVDKIVFNVLTRCVVCLCWFFSHENMSLWNFWNWNFRIFYVLSLETVIRKLQIFTNRYNLFYLRRKGVPVF